MCEFPQIGSFRSYSVLQTVPRRGGENSHGNNPENSFGKNSHARLILKLLKLSFFLSYHLIDGQPDRQYEKRTNGKGVAGNCVKQGI